MDLIKTTNIIIHSQPQLLIYANYKSVFEYLHNTGKLAE